MVDRAALEMRSTRKRTGGSNPSLSAKTLLEGFKTEAVIADRAYDNNDLRAFVAIAAQKP